MAQRPQAQPPRLSAEELAAIDGRMCLPCCGWWVAIQPRDRRLRVCGRCGHWLMDFGDGVPVLLTQAEIEELPERAPHHAAEMVRLTAALVENAPCCKRALGYA
jgi:hypothetical protein